METRLYLNKSEGVIDHPLLGGEVPAGDRVSVTTSARGHAQIQAHHLTEHFEDVTHADGAHPLSKEAEMDRLRRENAAMKAQLGLQEGQDEN